MANLQQNKKVLLVFGLLTSVMFIIVIFIVNPLIDGKTGIEVIKLQLAFKTSLGKSIIEKWNETGQNNFLKYIYTDYIYALSYSIFLSSIYLNKLLKNNTQISTRHVLILLIPIIAGIFDMLENTIEIIFIKNPNNFSELLFFIHSILALMKWLAFPIILYFIFKRNNMRNYSI